MGLKKCFGIISYLPSDPSRRERRTPHLTNLLTKLSVLWPDVDILVIAQNWKNYQEKKKKNNLVRIDFENALGILEARKVLREEFLKLDYDYIIYLDDDATIKCDTDTVHLEYMEEIDKHPSGLCWIHSDNHWHHHDDMTRAPLNLYAMSRDLVEAEPLVEVSIQKNEAYEDDTYAELIWHKYPDKYFDPPKGIYCTHSFRGVLMAHQIWHNTNYIIECYEDGLFDLDKIKENKEKWQM